MYWTLCCVLSIVAVQSATFSTPNPSGQNTTSPDANVTVPNVIATTATDGETMPPDVLTSILSSGAIAGIAVGSVAGVALMIVGVIVCVFMCVTACTKNRQVSPRTSAVNLGDV
ncbi:uncharacterized protein LOC144859012 [Branchiostoma floridae x Branchiostoma japonicum]